MRSKEKFERPKNKRKPIICSRNNCDKVAVALCTHCNRGFCKIHMEPVLTANLRYISDINNEPDSEKRRKYIHDWNREDGHPCAKFTEDYLKEHPENMVQTEKAANQNFQAGQTIHEMTIEEIEESRNKIGGTPDKVAKTKGLINKSENKSHMSNTSAKGVGSASGFFKSKIKVPLILKSVVIAVVLTILGANGLGLIVTPLSAGNFLNSTQSLVNFVILFVILIVYDKVTTRRLMFYQEAIIAVLLDIFVCLGLSTGAILLIIGLILGFTLTLFGSILGQTLYDFAREGEHIAAFTGAIAFLVAIWAIYIIAVNYSSVLSSIQVNLGGYIASASSNGNPTGPYFTANDLNSVFGFGLYSASALNPTEIAIGNGTGILFRTPIQHLLFNFTLKNISVQSVNYVEFYNPYNVTFNETLIQTTQASFILVTAARSATVLGQRNGTNYFAVTNFVKLNGHNYSDSDSFIMGAQKANYLATISCSGRACNPKTLNGTISKISLDLQRYN